MYFVPVELASFPSRLPAICRYIFEPRAALVP